ATGAQLEGKGIGRPAAVCSLRGAGSNLWKVWIVRHSGDIRVVLRVQSDSEAYGLQRAAGISQKNRAIIRAGTPGVDFQNISLSGRLDRRSRAGYVSGAGGIHGDAVPDARRQVCG